ncbi:TonB-dependent receptor [Inhella proteolytica]|uniref:TonB-dependent receptor n=1 Tax=Inhella proteolytica TaxID=2795029 RepID=A0A931J1D9_9BURK|nr:TonB-dependent receptor [Inhella proteolytica]MBH9575893.1 TonB-dependent receptor [Inhella proteolytica]
MKTLLPALLMLAAGAAAAEPTLEELLRQELDRPSAELGVSTAARLAQSGSAAPGVTHVVTRQDIQRLGLRSLADILQLFPGVYLSEDGLFTQVGVRGLGRPGDLNSRVLFLLDGLRLNENIYDAGQIDQDFLVEVSQIERVEFTPGSGSALYGNNAFLGVLNVITQRANQARGLRVRATLGEQLNRTASASWAQRLESGNEWGLAFSRWWGQRLPLTVPDPDPLKRSSAARELNWDRAERFNLYGLYRGLMLRVGTVDRVHGLPTPLNPSDDDGELGQGLDRTRIHYGHASWEGDLGAGWQLQLAGAKQLLVYRNDEPFVSASGRRGVFLYETRGRWDLLEARAAGPLGERHELMLGAEVQRDRQQRIRYFIAGQEDEGVDRRSRRIGLFVQDSWTLAPRQHLLLGLRHDAVRGQGSRLSPRLAYSAADEQGRQFKLSLGNAFRAPNRSEILTNEFQDIPVPPPERIRSLEAAWDAPLSPRWRYRLVAYVGRIRNLIDAGPEASFYSASEPVRSKGLEAQLDGRWGQGGSAQLWLALQRSRYASGSELSNSPHGLAGWRAWHPLGAGWRLALHGSAVQRRQAEAYSLPGHALLHAHLQWEHPQGGEVFLGLRNLAGRRYWDAPGVSGGPPSEHEGRVVWLGFDWRFGP